MHSENTHRGIGAVSGLIGLGVTIASVALLVQILNYQYQGRLYNYNDQLQGTDYYSFTYNFFGFQFNPLIGIAAGGLVMGILQMLTTFLLCCGKDRHKYSMSMGWIGWHILTLLAAIVCFSIGVYYRVYFAQVAPTNAYRDANSGFLRLYGNDPLSGYAGYGGLYNFGGLNGGYYGVNSGLFGYNGYYNPTGQAYCAMMGIDAIFLLIAVIAVGCSLRKDEFAEYDHNHHKSYVHHTHQ